MNVLVINCGSSSLKFQLINSDTEAVLAKGLCERIGIDGSLTYQPAGGEKKTEDKAMPTHTEAIQFVIDALTDADRGVVRSLDEIGAVGHRVVHGGEKFASSAVITDEMIKAVEECNDLAPLHNPANLIGIRACQELMPGTPMVAVFDTAFHQTMPEKAYMYGLPYEYYEKIQSKTLRFPWDKPQLCFKKNSRIVRQTLRRNKDNCLPLRKRRKYLRSRKWKICRYFYGTYSIGRTCNGNTFGRYRSGNFRVHCEERRS